MDFATTNFRYVRVIEGTPARNVSRCVGIGIGGKPARLARELIACGPVLLTDTAAGRTSPAGVARVNEFDRHSDKPALVGNLRLEIREGPRVQDSALLWLALILERMPFKSSKAIPRFVRLATPQICLATT